MRKIIVGFSRPKGKIFPYLSWMIRLFQGGTKYSHVYFKFPLEKMGKSIIYQASGLQVNFVSESVFQKNVHVVDEVVLEITKEQFRHMLVTALENAGKPYSIKQLFGIVWHRVFGKLPKFLKDDGNEYICSELVAEVLVEMFDYSFNKDTQLLTPKDIHKAVIEIEQNN